VRKTHRPGFNTWGSFQPFVLLTWQNDTIYLLTAIGLSPGGSSTVHIYTKTIHRTTQNKQYIEQHNNLGECVPCPVLTRFTLAFALKLSKKHGKTCYSQVHSRVIINVPVYHDTLNSDHYLRRSGFKATR